MAVICISRELGTGGEQAAQELARITGYRFIERAQVEIELQVNNIGSDELRKYDERRPGIWTATPEKRAKFLHYLEMVLCKEALKGDCILLGRGAGVFLGRVPGVISVKLVAPLYKRLEKLMDTRNYDERRAEHEIKHSDHERSGFHRYFFQTDWKDSSLYDLTINTSSLEPGQIARTIDSFRALTVRQEHENIGEGRLKGMMVRLEVIDEIVYKNAIPIDSLVVFNDNGKVTLQGVADNPKTAEAAVEAAQAVEGVQEVIDNIIPVPYYSEE